MAMAGTKKLSLLLLPCVSAFNIPSHNSLPGAASYTVPSTFPTGVFSKYYVKPGSNVEPQPVVFDPVLKINYPEQLTDPRKIPTVDTDPVVLPEGIRGITKSTAEELVQIALDEITNIINDGNAGISSSCDKCMAALGVGQMLAKAAPQYVPDAMISLCTSTGFQSAASCKSNYASNTFGAIWTQILALADVTGLDGRYICNQLSGNFCPTPGVGHTADIPSMFPKPKPTNPKVRKASGKTVKVLHLSDFHLDARYDVFSEASCASGLCCRYNAAMTSPAQNPAPLFGAYRCDTPYFLGAAALQSIASLTGTGRTQADVAWTIYTGDLVAHDAQNQISQKYIEYVETSVFTMFKHYISGPIYAALGNHDSTPENVDAPHSLPGPLGEQFSWNYNHVAGLWKSEGWISNSDAQEAASHYAAYAVKVREGLRIITLNTDFWYKTNYLNFINSTNPDVSGNLQFLINELQKAEDAGDRVWIVGHVLTGWDGSNPLPNPTDLFYQIIDRYSPHVIANIFFGHTHEDQFMIYYANNGTIQDAAHALATGWIGPSVTPLTNLNSGYRMYEVDTGSFDIIEAHTFYADVSSFADLPGTHHGPVFKYEYSTRDTYGPAVNWPKDAPLNATFWHHVTEAMEKNSTLVQIHNTFQGKSSVMSPACTTDTCFAAKICYMRSGSVALGRQCHQGFGSVQSAFSG
ncbi:sphingomyelin phosphodiesterase-like protein [Xylogone sp. PMI_703]|nr:sphingomyelin phosphodiesterase-like protein [Xylogone sp. PMI_703]